MPFAPGRFSTTTCCLNVSVRRSATKRARESPVPPAAVGTTIRMGLDGYCCACAVPARTIASAMKGTLMSVARALFFGQPEFLFDRLHFRHADDVEPLGERREVFHEVPDRAFLAQVAQIRAHRPDRREDREVRVDRELEPELGQLV